MNKKIVALVALGALISWQLSSVVGGSSNGKAICVNQFSKITRKDKCAVGETELASNVVKRKAIRKRLMASEPAVLRGGNGVRTSAAGTQSLTGAVGQSVRSYTYALTFEPGWDGRVETTCGAFEVPITSTATAYINGTKVPAEDEADIGELFFSGQMLSYRSNNAPYRFLTPRIDGGVITPQDDYFDESLDRSRYVIDPVWPSGLILYVTQVCAPLTELAPG